MKRTFIHWLRAACACLLLASTAFAHDAHAANLVDVEWLRKNLGAEDLLLLDASGQRRHAAKHIPGAASVDLYSYGAPHKSTVAQMESRIQSWGVSPGRRIVVYDEGGGQMAPWLFFELHYHGYPAEQLFILDGGLAKWEASGGAVTRDPTPAPARGTYRVAKVREEERVRLPEFIAASGDPSRHALVEALEPSYHFGGAKFFDRAGHIPNAVMMPTPDFYNADKTFKSPAEIRKMASYLGVTPEHQVHSHCGGGVAATVPWFALKFISGYSKVKLYKESQLEWLRDERGLPFWTYAAPNLRRDANWVSSWGSPMMRMYGVAEMSVVDVRGADDFAKGHVPFAVNLPVEIFKRYLDQPAKLAEVLGPAGVNSGHEAVIVSAGGLNPGSALAFLALEMAGQKKVSVLGESVDEFGLSGFTLTTEPTVVGAPKTPGDFAVPPARYEAKPRPGLLIRDARATTGAYPKVFIASGKAVPETRQEGKVVHVPYTELVNADGTPKAAKEIWNTLVKAGVPRYAEIFVYADELGEAAVNYVVLKMMGFPDVKVLAL